MDITTDDRVHAALNAAGYRLDLRGDRLYLVDPYGAEVGFLRASDDGSSGTVRDVKRRAGYVAGIIRKAIS